jgi:hypothetical protein
VKGALHKEHSVANSSGCQTGASESGSNN